MSLSPKENSRRKFLFQLSSAATTLAFANAAVYSVGSAFKSLDGSMTAGAKCLATGANTFSGTGWADDTNCSSIAGPPGNGPQPACCSGTDNGAYSWADTFGAGNCLRTCN